MAYGWLRCHDIEAFIFGDEGWPVWLRIGMPRSAFVSHRHPAGQGECLPSVLNCHSQICSHLAALVEPAFRDDGSISRPAPVGSSLG